MPCVSNSLAIRLPPQKKCDPPKHSNRQKETCCFKFVALCFHRDVYCKIFLGVVLKGFFCIFHVFSYSVLHVHHILTLLAQRLQHLPPSASHKPRLDLLPSDPSLWKTSADAKHPAPAQGPLLGVKKNKKMEETGRKLPKRPQVGGPIYSKTQTSCRKKPIAMHLISKCNKKPKKMKKNTQSQKP